MSNKKIIDCSKTELVCMVKRLTNLTDIATDIEANIIAEDIVKKIDWNNSSLMHKRLSWMRKDYPGDFLSRLDKVDYTNNYVILFKQDIDKLSGFIRYGVNKLAVIFINYKRWVGQQNRFVLNAMK